MKKEIKKIEVPAKRPTSGGEVLRNKKGNVYFKELVEKGWKIRREKQRLFDLQNKDSK